MVTDAFQLNTEIPKKNSYGQILRSSSIIGGAQGINYLIGMVRIKLVALLLGPEGVGLVGLYNSIVELVSSFSRFGVNESGVREIADAQGGSDSVRVAATAATLRRLCWIAGIFGWVLTALLAYPLSLWTFGSDERTWAIVGLGAAVFFGVVAAGESGFLQGLRRIGDLARLNVLVAIAGTLIAVGVYAVFGERGIVPVLIASGAVNLGVSRWFARKVEIEGCRQPWTETFLNSKRLIHLGAAFMYGTVLSTVVMLGIRSFVVRDVGLDASGIYQAAWGLSGMFAGFIIGAMGTDFYPRLTAVANDNEKVNSLVNEQIEIGILLALPGLLGTIAFAPGLMFLFYSAEFLPSAGLLPWMVVGVFGQVISFPLGFIQRAKGKARWIILSQSHTHLLHFFLAVLMVQSNGVEGAAWAFALSTSIHGLVVFSIARRLSNFSWSLGSAKLATLAAAVVIAGFAFQLLTDGFAELAFGSVFTAIAGVISLRGISSRLGANHRIMRAVLRLPGARVVCGF